MKRLLALLLALSMVISLLPATVLAEEMPQEDTTLTEQLEEPEGDTEEKEEPKVDPEEKTEEEPKEDPEEKTEEDPQEDSEEKPQEDPQGDSEGKPQEEPKVDPEEKSQEEPKADPEEKPQEDPMKDPEEEENSVSEEAALEEGEYFGNCGKTEEDKLTWSFDPATGTLTISGTGDMDDYSSAPWADYDVQRLVIEEGVTSVGKNAFYNMVSLTGELALPESMKTIGSSAFYCTKLTSVSLNAGLEKIGSSAFRESAITGELRFGNKLTYLEDSAFDSTGITKVTLPNQLRKQGYDPDDSWKGYNVTAFKGCQSLTAIEVSKDHPDFQTIDGVLYSKDGKTLLSGPAGKTGTLVVPEGVETISTLAFYNGQITEVSLPKSLTSVGEAAFLGSKLEKVIYAGARKENIGREESAFPEGVQWTDHTCGDNLLWSYEEATKTLTISGTGDMDDYKYDSDREKTDAPWAELDVQALVIEEGVTSVGSYAFFDMASLTAVTLNDGLVTISNSAFSGCENLTLESGLPDSLQKIGTNAFFACKALTGELTFGSKLTTLGMRAFAYTGITKVTLPSQVTAENYDPEAFMGCESLTEILVSEENKSFQSIDGVLYSADVQTLLSGPSGKIGTLTVPDGVKTIKTHAFYNGHITEVNLPATVTSVERNAFAYSQVRQVQYAGSWADKDKITLGDGNDVLQNAQWHYAAEGSLGENLNWSYNEQTDTLTVSGEGAIPAYEDGGQKLPWQGADIGKLVIGEGITAIGSGAFAGLPLTQARLPASLAECNFPETFTGFAGLETVEIAPENEAFASVDGVVYDSAKTRLLFCPAGRTQTLTIPDGTQTIAAKAFAFSKVRGLFLPASLQTVEENAFSEAKLSWVTYPGTPEQREALLQAIADGNDPLKNADWKTAETTNIGEGLEWTLENKVLTVTGTGAMDDYSASFPAPWQGKTVNKLVVKEGVTYLGSYAFAGLAIKTVTLPESLASIGENAFAKTPKAIQLTYGGSAERWTYGLQKDGCGLNSPKVTAKGKNVSGDLTWSYNAKTKTLTISGSGWTEGYSEEDFLQGQKPDWLAWGIPAEKLVFSGKEIGIGARTFYGMTSLKQVTLPQEMQAIGKYAFAYSGLSGKLTIPGGTNIWRYAFRGTQITSLVLPEDAWVQDGNAFADCKSLTDIYYSGYEDVLRKRLGDNISQEVTIHGQKQYGGEVGINVCWSLDKQGTLTLSETDNTYSIVPNFESYADTPWAGLTVKKLVLVNIDIIGANAFNGCASLTGDLTLENVCSVGENAFAGTGLKTLRIKQSQPKEILEMYLEGANNDYGTNFQPGIAKTAFDGSKLTDVYYSFAESYLREQLGEDHPLLKKKLHCTYPYGGWDFRLMENVEVQWTIDSKGILRVSTDVIPDYKPLEAPWSEYKVTGLNLKGVTSIGSNAFYGLNGLTKLSIPNTVKTIGDQAFYGCTGITGTLTIPEGVTEIGDRAFGNLPKITALKLPASLESLGEGAFDGCRGLKTITFAGSMAKLVELDRYGDLWYLGAAITCQGSSAGTLDCGANWTLDSKNTLTIEGTGTLTLTSDERDMLNDLGVRKMVIKPGITEIGEKGFFDMNITEVSLPASLESLGRYALDNYYIKTVTVAKGSKFLAVKSGILYSLDMKKLLLVPTGIKKLTIPDSVTTVAEGALANNSLTTLVLGAGIGPDSVEGDMGLAGLVSYNNVTSLTVSKKNKQLRASGNVLFAGSTLVLYPYLKPGTEYRVPEGTTAIAKNVFCEVEHYFQYLRKLVLPVSMAKVEDGSIYSYNLELVVLGKETAIGENNRCSGIWGLKNSQAEADAKENNYWFAYLEEETVTLHFETEETGVTGMPKDIPNVTPGGKAIIPKKAPSRKGYTFLGWQEKPNNTFAWSMPIYQPGTTLTLTEDMTLVPLFRKNGLVQEGSCGPDTSWTLDKKGTLTISGQGKAYIVQPENTNRLTVKKLVIEEGVTSLEQSIFQYVTIKGQVTIPASMEQIGAGVFASQTGITGVSFASSVQARGLQIDPGAFYGCTGIKGAVTLPAQLVGLNRMTFEGCSNITALNTATTVTMGGYSSVDGVLYGAGGRTLLRCPEGKTGAITIPTATKSIGSGAFRNSKITKVYYQDGKASWKNIQGREYLPVYPTFAYEIRYTSNVESPSFAHVTMRHANPNSILASQTITLKNPTMQGYLFKGWYNEAGKKVTKIAKGTKEAITLTAHFTPITYTVAYNANGGKGKTTGTPCKYDEQWTVGENKFTRTGYTFVGWNTAKNGTGTWYYEGQTPKDVYSAPKNLTAKNKGTVTLYAQWQANSYTVKFDANVPEGMQYSGTMEPQSFTYDKTQALTANGFARTGYTFTGWKTQSNSKTVYKNEASVKNLTSAVDGEVTLYAQWAARKITVVFHSNYPNGAKEKTAKQTVTCGKEVKLAKNTFAAVQGYTFAGWSETENGEVKYTNTQSDTFYSDKTIDLYAVWTKNP